VIALVKTATALLESGAVPVLQLAPVSQLPEAVFVQVDWADARSVNASAATKTADARGRRMVFFTEGTLKSGSYRPA
jgi:hypothetical protein